MALLVWIEGARPKTLVAGIAPVCIGSVIASAHGMFSITSFLLVLTFSLAIQVGTNFANDYFDFFHGADTPDRKGPKRLTASKAVQPYKVLFAMVTMFVIALFTSIALIPVAGIWSLLIAASSIFFGVFYTAGPYSLAYTGLGEVFVLLFFGLLATCGAEYAQTQSISPESLIAAFGPGLLSTAILVVNNLRDVEEDTRARKRTLAVRLGSSFARYEYAACLFTAGMIPLITYIQLNSHIGILTASAILVPALALIRNVFQFKDARELNSVLAKTGMLLALYTTLFCVGWYAL